MGAVGRLRHVYAAFRSFFYLMDTLNAHVVLLGFPDFLVYLGGNGLARSCCYRMGELGGRGGLIHFLEAELGFLFPSGRVNGALLDLFLFLGNLGPRRLRLVRRLIRMADMLL